MLMDLMPKKPHNLAVTVFLMQIMRHYVLCLAVLRSESLLKLQKFWATQVYAVLLVTDYLENRAKSIKVTYLVVFPEKGELALSLMFALALKVCAPITSALSSTGTVVAAGS